MRLVWNISDTG